LIYQNYHRHSMYTNAKVPDSTVTNEAYAKRAAELGHGIISTCEHGWQGRYIEGYELAQKYNLKFVFGAEAYWVKDRFEKDRTNCHIYIGARNENGRQAINNILAEASISGYYGQPRIDLSLLTSLPPQDVIVTTACVAYWKYYDVDSITASLAAYFKYFFLEVQCHNTESQRELNKRILKLAKDIKVPIIFGCDSHFIYPGQAQERTDYLASKEMNYPDEEGWYLDYPDGDTVYNRFASQGILSDSEIRTAINNTAVFLEVEEYHNPCFTKDIKMPTLLPELTQEEKDEFFEDLIWRKYVKETPNIPQDKWDLYEMEIAKEIEIVKATKHADYFLLDYAIVKKGKEMGGIITSSGRGSGVSFYINKLLGFTDVDRISAEVKMYPERFMSPTRILEAKTLADLDLNLANPEVFAQAQIEVMGENHSYPMITYITMKPMAAWKMYAKSQDVAFSISNTISQRIQQWQQTVFYAPEEEKELVDINDYIDSEYVSYYRQSEIYQGIVSTQSPHPCSYLVYQGDIRREIGLVILGDKVCCLMDGKWAEDYKFLKNDLLKVMVVELIDKVYKRIGIPKHRVKELLQICASDDKAWNIYKTGCTQGINQVEQSQSSGRVMKYAPKNISELCAFMAAVRPGFKSMYGIFEKREHFDYKIKSFDELIQTPFMSSTFVLYQEMAMATLNYSGIPLSECYEIIKNIAKKRPEKVFKYKEQFLKGFQEVLINRENKDVSEADELSRKVWQILEDSSAYSFNASHSYCVALDSLYCAFLKSHYPLEFYEVFLTILSEKSEKARMSAVKEEAEKYYNISFPPYRFGQDNRKIVADTRHNSITNSLSAIKNFGQAISEVLYNASKLEFHNFVDVLRYLNKNKITSSKIEPLIKIDYFSRFGNINELLRITKLFDFLRQGNAKSVSLGKIDDPNLLEIFMKYSNSINKDGSQSKNLKLNDIESIMAECESYVHTLNLPDADYKEKIAYQSEILGYVDIATGHKEDRLKLFVQNVFPLKSDGKVWGYLLSLKSIGSGKIAKMNIYAAAYDKCPINKLDIIQMKNYFTSKTGRLYLQEYERIS